jgi:primosomal protein N'
VALGEPAAVLAEETAMRSGAGLPPFSALALVSGTLATPYAEALAAALAEDAASGDGDLVSSDGRGDASVAPLGDNRYLVQAPRHEVLCDFLARVPRPAGRGLRVEVDPASI